MIPMIGTKRKAGRDTAGQAFAAEGNGHFTESRRLRQLPPAAPALALHVAGSTENFAELMNSKAQELGVAVIDETQFLALLGEGDADRAQVLALIRPEDYMDGVRRIFPAAVAARDGRSVDLLFEEE